MGELLWDCFADRRLPGGAPANVAFHARQLGYRGIVCSRVGDDADGRELTGYLASRGLETDWVQVDRERPTGRVTIDAGDPSRPAYTIHENAAWDALAFDAPLAGLMASAAAVCVGTLAQRSEAARTTIRRCLSAATRALIVYDVNLRPPWFRRSWIEETLERSRIVKLNLEEVAVLAELLDLGAADPAGFAQRLLARTPAELICITRAEAGCLMVTRSETHEVAGTAVEVADAVGAGDAFTAALIAGRLRGWPTGDTARFANRVGARVASQPGAMAPLGADLRSRPNTAEGGDLAT